MKYSYYRVYKHLGSFSVEDPETNLATYFVLYEIVFDYKHNTPLFTDFEEHLAALQYGFIKLLQQHILQHSVLYYRQ